jgi:hypothetical protein
MEWAEYPCICVMKPTRVPDSNTTEREREREREREKERKRQRENVELPANISNARDTVKRCTIMEDKSSEIHCWCSTA